MKDLRQMASTHKASPSQWTKYPLTSCYIADLQDERSVFHLLNLTWARRFWYYKAVYTKPVLMITPQEVIEHIQYARAARII